MGGPVPDEVRRSRQDRLPHPLHPVRVVEWPAWVADVIRILAVRNYYVQTVHGPALKDLHQRLLARARRVAGRYKARTSHAGGMAVSSMATPAVRVRG